MSTDCIRCVKPHRLLSLGLCYHVRAKLRWVLRVQMWWVWNVKFALDVK
jgi:hypothetical protein